jgi:hypothetical protein
MDRWAWEQLGPWLQLRATLPVGALFCVLRGPDRRPPVGTRWGPIAAAPPPLAPAIDAGSRLISSERPRGGDVA